MESVRLQRVASGSSLVTRLAVVNMLTLLTAMVLAARLKVTRCLYFTFQYRARNPST